MEVITVACIRLHQWDDGRLSFFSTTTSDAAEAEASGQVKAGLLPCSGAKAQDRGLLGRMAVGQTVGGELGWRRPMHPSLSQAVVSLS